MTLNCVATMRPWSGKRPAARSPIHPPSRPPTPPPASERPRHSAQEGLAVRRAGSPVGPSLQLLCWHACGWDLQACPALNQGRGSRGGGQGPAGASPTCQVQRHQQRGVEVAHAHQLHSGAGRGGSQALVGGCEVLAATNPFAVHDNLQACSSAAHVACYHGGMRAPQHVCLPSPALPCAPRPCLTCLEVKRQEDERRVGHRANNALRSRPAGGGTRTQPTEMAGAAGAARPRRWAPGADASLAPGLEVTIPLPV